MEETKNKVRIDNIKRAKIVWRRKASGAKSDEVAQELSVTVNTIENILKYTDSDYYKASTDTESFYDTKLMIQNEIDNNKKQLKKITNYVASKSNFFLRIFEITVVVITLLFVV